MSIYSFEVKFQPTNAESLLKLADGLECENLPATEKWDFSILLSRCGTIGDAIAQLPALFPEHFKSNHREEAMMRRVQGIDGCPIIPATRKFFALTNDECRALFFRGQDCYWQHSESAGITYMGKDTTAKQVAANIRNFVAWKLSRIP